MIDDVSWWRYEVASMLTSALAEDLELHNVLNHHFVVHVWVQSQTPHTAHSTLSPVIVQTIKPPQHF